MSLSKPKRLPSYELPEEMLSEILKRLPVKYVLRCRCVQKSWYGLITTPMFISLHCNYQKMTAHINPKYLLFHNLNTHELTIRSDDAQCQEYCNYVLDWQSASQCYAQSNGLFCYRQHDHNPKIVLWNPLVRKLTNLPDSPLSTFQSREIKWKALAFGYLPEVNDYVVVDIVKPKSTAGPDHYIYPYTHDNPYEQYSHSVVIGVYSLNTNSWKKISQDNVSVDSIYNHESVFVNGTAFWVGSNLFDSYELVMYFDTKTNILRQVKIPSWILPNDGQLDDPLIYPFRQSIAFFVVVEDSDDDEDDEDYGSFYLDIWVLKDNITDESPWEQKMRVSLTNNVSPRIVGIRNNGETILAKSNSMISYDIDTNEPYEFVDSCDRLTSSYSNYEEASRPPFDVRPFVETLILLNIGLQE